MYVGKVAEGGNGCFTTESRPHNDWLGPGWWRDLAICLDAAKKNNLQMWIFDEKLWPSQAMAGRVPPRYAAKRLAAAALDVEGPREFADSGYSGPRYIAAVAGRVAADGKIDGRSLVDLAPYIRDGKLSWRVPAGKWKVMKFSYVQAPPLMQSGQLAVDGASQDCVDWFLQTVYQPHYDHFKADFGKTIRGFFFDEPETPGDWGTELNATLARLEGRLEEGLRRLQVRAGRRGADRRQVPIPRRAGRDLGPHDVRRHDASGAEQHGVESIGHFMEHAMLLRSPRVLRRRHAAIAEIRQHGRDRRRLFAIRHRQASHLRCPDLADAEDRQFDLARLRQAGRRGDGRDLRRAGAGPRVFGDEVVGRPHAGVGRQLLDPPFVQSAVALRQRLPAVFLQRRLRAALAAVSRLGPITRAG